MYHLISLPLLLVLFILYYILRAHLHRLAGEIGRQRCLLSRYLSLLDWLAAVDDNGSGGFDRLMSVYARQHGASVDCQFVSSAPTESSIHHQETQPQDPLQDSPTTQAESRPEPTVHVPTDSRPQQHRLRPSLLLRVIPSSSEETDDDGGLVVMATIDTGAPTSLISAPLAGRLLSMRSPPASFIRLLNAPVPVQRFRGYSRTFWYQSLAGVRLAQCLSRSQHQHVRPYIIDQVRLIIDGAWREATFVEPYVHHQFVHDELAELLEPTSGAAAVNGHHRAWTHHAKLAFDDGRVHMIIGQDLINRHLFRPGMSVYQLAPCLAGLCTPMGVAVMGVLDKAKLGTYLRLLHKHRLLICESPSTIGTSLSPINEQQQQQQQAQLNRLLTVQRHVSFWRLLTVSIPGAILVANELAALGVVTCLAAVVVGACQALLLTVTDQLWTSRLRTISDRLLLTLMEWAVRCDVHYRRHVHLPLGRMTGDLSSLSVRFLRPMDQDRFRRKPYITLVTRGGGDGGGRHPTENDAKANNDQRGAPTVLRARLDTGAPSSFITARLVSRLGLETQPGDPAPPGAINDGSHLPKVSLSLLALNLRPASIYQPFTLRVLPDISAAAAAFSSCSNPYDASHNPPGVSKHIADAVDTVLGIKLSDRNAPATELIEIILGADALARMILPSFPLNTTPDLNRLLRKTTTTTTTTTDGDDERRDVRRRADHLTVHKCATDNVSILVTRFAAAIQGYQCPAEDVAAGEGSFHYYSDFNKKNWTATAGRSRLEDGRAALAHGAIAAVLLFVDYLLFSWLCGCFFGHPL